MDENTLRAALTGLPLGGLRFLPQTGSTNSDAAAWRLAGAPHLSLVVAEEQTAGRGRAGRVWHSPAGSSLAFSLVLQPNTIQPAMLPHFTALGALAVRRALKALYGLEAQVKWPNDVLVAGKKVCGVLAEAHWLSDQLDAVILGIGINLTGAAVQTAAAREGGLRFPAAGLADFLDQPLEPVQVLRSVVAQVLALLEQTGSPAFLAEWQTSLAFFDEVVQISAPDGQILQTGQIMGLQADGALRLQTADRQEMSFHAGEIRLRPYQ